MVVLAKSFNGFFIGAAWVESKNRLTWSPSFEYEQLAPTNSMRAKMEKIDSWIRFWIKNGILFAPSLPFTLDSIYIREKINKFSDRKKEGGKRPILREGQSNEKYLLLPKNPALLPYFFIIMIITKIVVILVFFFDYSRYIRLKSILLLGT